MTTRSLPAQTLVVLRLGLSGVRRRAWSSLNAVVGTASAVCVLVALISIGDGYREVIRRSGHPDNVIAMRAGAKSELESQLSADAVHTMAHRPEVLRDALDRPLAAGETFAIVSLGGDRGESPMNIALRGVEPVSLALREGFRLRAGRLFTPGRNELVVGARAAQQFNGLEVGRSVHVADGRWTVVGIFEAGGGVAESEVWTDRATMQSAYQRGDGLQVAYLRLRPGVQPAELAAQLDRRGGDAVKLEREEAYYAEQSSSMFRFVSTLSYVTVALMSLGAAFAALNTSHAAVAARSREIATLSALGFADAAIRAAIVAEALLLSLAGAVLGAGIAYAAFNGHSASTLFFSRNFSQVVFDFHVGAGVLVQAALVAATIGLAGALVPAWRATAGGSLLLALGRRL